MMYRIYERFEVSSAHRLENYEGKCNNLHGHNYIVEVWVETERLNEQGMVVDFTNLKTIVMTLDHQYLNDLLQMDNPTAERIAKWIQDQILDYLNSEKMNGKVKVRVWEDKDSYAEVE